MLNACVRNYRTDRCAVDGSGEERQFAAQKQTRMQSSSAGSEVETWYLRLLIRGHEDLRNRQRQ
jgi:phosphodiesterase/alkaline phosphatase D-like protein